MPLAEAASRRLGTTWRLLAKELGAFGVVGGVAFVIDIAVFQLLYAHVGLGAVTAKLASTLISMTVAYFGNRYWSFSHRARTGIRREYTIFAMVNTATLLLNVGAVGFVRYGLDHKDTLALQAANVMSIALGTVIRYVSYRQWVFPSHGPAAGRGATPVGPVDPGPPPPGL